MTPLPGLVPVGERIAQAVSSVGAPFGTGHRKKAHFLEGFPNDLSPSVGVGSDVSGLSSFPATSCLPGRDYLHPDLVHAFEAVLPPCATAVSTVAPAQAVA